MGGDIILFADETPATLNNLESKNSMFLTTIFDICPAYLK
jgi:hypothetical protein